jgi:hypothetical protein
MLYLAEFTNKITGEIRIIFIDEVQLSLATETACEMKAKMVRQTGLYWFVTVDEDRK